MFDFSLFPFCWFALPKLTVLGLVVLISTYFGFESKVPCWFAAWEGRLFPSERLLASHVRVYHLYTEMDGVLQAALAARWACGSQA